MSCAPAGCARAWADAARRSRRKPPPKPPFGSARCRRTARPENSSAAARRSPGERFMRAAAWASAALAASALLLGPPLAAGAQTPRTTLDLRPPGEATFTVAFAADVPVLGPAKLSKPGAARPNVGEIAVSVAPSGMAPYAKIAV